MDRINSLNFCSDYEYEDDFGDDYDDYEEIIYEVKLYWSLNDVSPSIL